MMFSMVPTTATEMIDNNNRRFAASARAALIDRCVREEAQAWWPEGFTGLDRIEGASYQGLQKFAAGVRARFRRYTARENTA